MLDISLCKNEKCKFKEDCYRFTAKSDEVWQTYGEFNCKDEDGIDSFFWKNGIPSVQPKNKIDTLIAKDS